MSDMPAALLSRRRKAAIIVQMLIADGGSLPLSSLPEPLQETLTGELADLRLLDRDMMAAVAAEFVDALDKVGMAAPGNRDGAIAALADHLSPDLARRLQSQRASVRDGDHWPVVAGLPIARLVQIMQAESVEICAVALSKLPVAKAAEVLAKTPGDRARRITYAMSLTADVTPDVVRRIGQALAQDYGQVAATAFDKAPVQRLGAILNSAASDTREDVLAGLGVQDADFASDVRRAIFTFKDIATRVKPADIANGLRAVDGAALTTAIAAALAGDADVVATAEFILDNISQRMAAQLRDQAAERGIVKKAEGEAAMAAVTCGLRDLVDSGAITLRDPDALGDAP
ncbi:MULTISPECIES: FliG C-terminal domain-containing protein [unclassified Yoonia]|uniref:FliG C-terminal domain-containing protein n=1 Tax=unclassified Yoonia TaxID=2629118 RepID=UPI002AFF8DE6|nr:MULTISPECIES: FliG C-terminal domain-containing protein [unclassified Yoonia]